MGKIQAVWGLALGGPCGGVRWHMQSIRRPPAGVLGGLCGDLGSLCWALGSPCGALGRMCGGIRQPMWHGGVRRPVR